MHLASGDVGKIHLYGSYLQIPALLVGVVAFLELSQLRD